MAEERVFTTERWTYTGIREERGERRTAWIDEAGEPHEYKDKASYVISYVYEIQICREADNTWRRGKPVFAGERSGTTDERREWAALDRAAQTALAMQVRERSVKRTDELAEAIEPILVIARSLHFAADRDALAVYVLRQINNQWHQPKTTVKKGPAHIYE